MGYRAAECAKLDLLVFLARMKPNDHVELARFLRERVARERDVREPAIGEQQQAANQSLPRLPNSTPGWEEVGIALSPHERVQAPVEGLRKHGVAAIHPGKDEGGSCDEANTCIAEKDLGGRQKIGVGVTTGR